MGVWVWGDVGCVGVCGVRVSACVCMSVCVCEAWSGGKYACEGE